MDNSGFRALLLILCLALPIHAATLERVSVSAPIANIRSGPGTDYDILWKVEKYYPIIILKKSGSWINFRDFEGDEGWIHRSLIYNKPSIISIKERCNIRSGPGTNHAILFTIGKGIPFLILKREKNWIQIQHADGDKGWIHKSLVW